MRGLILALLVGLYGNCPEHVRGYASLRAEPSTASHNIAREPLLSVDVFVEDFPDGIDGNLLLTQEFIKTGFPIRKSESVGKEPPLNQNLFGGRVIEVHRDLIFMLDANDKKFCLPSKFIGGCLTTILDSYDSCGRLTGRVDDLAMICEDIGS